MFRPFLLLVSLFCAESADIRPGVLYPSPAAKVASPQTHHAPVSKGDGALGEVGAILERWEVASKQQEILLRSQRENLLLHISRSLNGHAAISAEKFVGQVDTRQLRAQFDWAIIESGDQEICLEAIPKDDTERLFYRSIRVWLSMSNAHLVRIQATDRQGRVRANWSVPETASAGPVSVASLEVDGIPPSPLPENTVQPASFPADKGPVRGPRGKRSGQPLPGPIEKNRQIRLASAVLNTGSVSAGESNLPVLRRSAPVAGALSGSEPTAPKETSPEINAILDKWEAASRKVKTAKIQLTRTVFNLKSEEERISKGELIYLAPSSVKLTLRSDVKNEQTVEKGQRIGRNGIPFRVVDGRAETWIWDSQELMWLDDEKKNFEILPLPEHLAHLSPFSRRFQLPFLIDIHAEQLRQNWSFTLSKSTKERVILIATPRAHAIRNNFSQCFVIVDCDVWQTSAVKYFDAGGASETVYRVDRREINQELPQKCFSPDFKNLGYKPVPWAPGEPFRIPLLDRPRNSAHSTDDEDGH